MAVADAPYVIALYGSRARGDYDEQSDVDVLAVGEPPPTADPIYQDASSHVSRYTWPEFEAMHAYGSLFLWHLKLQCKPLDYDVCGYERFRSLMKTLPRYSPKRMAGDIASFELSLSDVEEALATGDTTYAYELSCLATTVRHSSILGCYLLGIPEFGRYSSVRRFCAATRLPGSLARDFAELYQLKMMVSAGQADRLASGDSLESYAASWLVNANRIVKEVAACAMQSSA